MTFNGLKFSKRKSYGSFAWVYARDLRDETCWLTIERLYCEMMDFIPRKYWGQVEWWTDTHPHSLYRDDRVICWQYKPEEK